MRSTSTPRLKPVRGRTSRIMFCALGLFTTLGQASPPASIAPYFAPPPAHSGQFGDYRSPLQFDDGTRVEQASDWPRRRAEIHREWMQRLGPWPGLIEHPQVQVQLQLSVDPPPLASDAFDVCIRFGEPPDARVIARRIAPNRRLLCASPTYLAQRGTPKIPSDLARHDCIGLRQGDDA